MIYRATVGMGKKTVIPFRSEGRFLGFGANDEGKIKYLRLQMAAGEYQFKMPKSLRFAWQAQLTPGDWIQVAGDREIQRDTGEERWVAYHVQTGIPSPVTLLPELPPQQPEPTVKPKPQAQTILVCRKSDCQNRGGREVCAMLETLLQQHPQGDQIQVRAVGCMKNCKAGPNVVFMPDKARYSRVKVDQIPALMERHCSTGSKTSSLSANRAAAP